MALALPGAIAAAVILLLARTRLAGDLVDHPNERSLHEYPTPRFGGLGIMAGALPVAAIVAGDRYGVALACALALALLSAVDDWRPLPVAVRLPAHILAAIAAAAALAHGPGGASLAVLATIAFAIVWMTNLFNFMDGTDGLAGTMAAIGFGAYAIAAAAAGSPPLALASAALASAAAGFLAFNFPPARIFMGDAGSVPLGFLAGALGAHGALEGAWPAWFPVLVFSPFIVDATVTLAKRALRRERVWVAHRGHYYQRAVLGGWSARRLLAAEALLAVGASASALYARGQGEMLQCGILVGWSALYAILIAAFEMPRANKNRNGTGARKSNGTPGEEE